MKVYCTRNDVGAMTMGSSRRHGGRILSIGMARTVCIDDGWARGSWWHAALGNDS